MDEGYFIDRDAKLAAREMREGDAFSAASLLKEDWQHMNPSEFARLIRKTSDDSSNCALATLQIERDGDVVVRTRNGGRFFAGHLKCEDDYHSFPPPVVIIEHPEHRRPPVVVMPRPDVHCPPPVVVMPRHDEHHRPPLIIIDRDRDRGRQPEPCQVPERPRVGVYDRRSEGPSDTLIGVVGGAIIGGVIGDGRKNGALKGALIGGAAGGILGHVSDEIKERR